MASFIVTRDGALFSKDGDSHEQIIAENKLDDGLRGGDFVRCEVAPKDNDYTLPMSEWEFVVDQKILPDWWNAQWGEECCRAALVEWAQHHIIRDGVGVCEAGETRVFCGTSTGTVNGGEGVFNDNATGTVNRGGEGVFNDTSTGTVNGGKGRFYGNAKRKDV
jgi:hypothetical protein